MGPAPAKHRAAPPRLERVGLLAGMGIAAVNLWTGAPLLGLWVGSRLVGDRTISMVAVAAVAVTILATCLVLVRILSALSLRYDRITGRKAMIRRHTPWLRALSGERPHDMAGETPPLTGLEYVLVATVLAAYLTMEVWFFFFSGSSIDGRSGR